MCGFTGYTNTFKKNKEVIVNMNKRIEHRGPDSENYYCDKYMHMGFRRLSIIDIEGGNQPIFNEDNSLVLMFNGEIYNYIELRDELINKGHKFLTNSDSEVIIHGYEEYSSNILKKLRGMFAFVIWDNINREVFLARDMFGIKPLYYGVFKKTLMFSSEIKSFLENPYFKKEFNKKTLKTYLTFQYNPLDETMFKNVFKLKPGYFLKYKDGVLIEEKYFNNMLKPINVEEIKQVRRIDKVIRDSVKYHSIADTPVASFLSSGVDSSYITSVLRPDNTYTVGFDINGFNEIQDAKTLSSELDVVNKSYLIGPEEFFESIPLIQYHSDEAHANLSCVPLFYLSRLASKDYKVVLSGEGADELFGGYHDYLESDLLLVYRKLPLFIRKAIGSFVKIFPYFKGRNFLIKGSMDIRDYYIGQANIMSEEEANSIIKEEYRTNIKPTDITGSYFDDVEGLDDITRKQYIDLNLWLPNDILLKADKLTMASSLELRVPFLDKEVFKVSSSLSQNLKINKNALRRASKKTIPSYAREREKLGFLVPFKYYLKNEKYYNLIKQEFIQEYTSLFFDQEKIIQILDMHYKGEKETHRQVYTIYSFLIWYKEYFINN